MTANYDYKRIVFSKIIPLLVHLNTFMIYSQGGNIDTTFMKTGTGVNGDIFKTLIQPNGKILISGNFSAYNGISRNSLMRLNSDGSLDTTFNIGTGFTGTVYTIALQQDGKILAGGQFTNFNGTNVVGLVRLNENGTLDPSFLPLFQPMDTSHTVNAIKVLTDNKIIITASPGIIKKLNNDGSEDTGFISNVSNGSVLDIKVQNDNKIIIAGEFTTINNSPRSRIARLNPNGSLDSSFNPEIGGNVTIYSTEVLPSNKIIVGGQGVQRGLLYRLNSNGTIDPTFASTGPGPNGTIRDMEIQENGKIVLVGDFNQYHAIHSNSIARLNFDGSFDNTFTSHAQISQTIYSLSIQPNKRIIIAGAFTTYSEVLVDKIVRVFGNCTCE